MNALPDRRPSVPEIEFMFRTIATDQDSYTPVPLHAPHSEWLDGSGMLLTDASHALSPSLIGVHELMQLLNVSKPADLMAHVRMATSFSALYALAWAAGPDSGLAGSERTTDEPFLVRYAASWGAATVGQPVPHLRKLTDEDNESDSR